MRRVRILPFKDRPIIRGLARRAGVMMCKIPTAFIPRPEDVVVNFGSTSLPPQWGGLSYKLLNTPQAVSNAVSKVTALTMLKEAGINVPKFTSDREQVKEWLTNGKRVFARTLTKASCGAGIVILDKPVNSVEEIPQAKLYTLYSPKKYEYRVHVWGDQAIDFQQKKRRKDVPRVDGDSLIRNWENGWIYARQGVVVPKAAVDGAIKAVKALGLDFGAVDIGWNEDKQRYYIYEVNTAPGLEGTTLEKYVNQIKELK